MRKILLGVIICAALCCSTARAEVDIDKLLAHSSSMRRAAAVKMLVRDYRNNTPYIISRLKKLTNDESNKVKLQVVAALRSTESYEAVPLLEDIKKHTEDEKLLKEVSAALEAIGPVPEHIKARLASIAEHNVRKQAEAAVALREWATINHHSTEILSTSIQLITVIPEYYCNDEKLRGPRINDLTWIMSNSPLRDVTLIINGKEVRYYDMYMKILKGAVNR